MRKISIIILIGLSISCSNNRDDNGLLWRIVSKDGKTGFIYGTIHLYPDDQIKISDKVFTLLKQCGTLALERNIKDSLDQRIFQEQINNFETIFKPYQVIFDKYGTGLINMEAELITIAETNNLKLVGLETSTELLDIMSKIPNSDRNVTNKSILEFYEMTIGLYNEERIDLYADTYLNKELGVETRKIMVNERNKNWLDNIEYLITQDNVFIGVGMGHLGGEKGLLNLLLKKGYKLERIKI